MGKLTDLGAKIAAATLTVDAALLRSTLDRLRGALDRPTAGPSIATGALVHDRIAVADSLRFIVERLRALDLTAVQALSGVVREYRTEHDAGKLREVFAGLQRGWQERVRRVLGGDKVPIVARLLASPAPDLLRILGKEDDENAHSDLIAWLLNPRKAPVVAPHALRRLAARLEDDSWRSRVADAVATDSLSVRREVKIAREFGGGSDLDRVDITISGPGFLLAIENKVWSREHGDQTQAYWSWIEPMSCLRGGLFLSPSGMTAACSEFKPLSYLELVSCLVEGPSIAPISNSEEIVLASYLKTLAREIIQVEMRAVRELATGMENP
jgi:PD-(D/E)XK nuclease superfamily